MGFGTDFMFATVAQSALNMPSSKSLHAVEFIFLNKDTKTTHCGDCLTIGKLVIASGCCRCNKGNCLEYHWCAVCQVGKRSDWLCCV